MLDLVEKKDINLDFSNKYKSHSIVQIPKKLDFIKK